MIDAEKLVDAIVERMNVAETLGTRSSALAEDIPLALEQYTKNRWARVQFYAAQSRALTPLFASRSRLLRALRDNFLARICRAPLLSNLVHGVLCGATSPYIFTTIPKREYLGFLEK